MDKIKTEERTMTPYLATGIAEGFEEAENEDERTAAWQYLIDTGICWKLQGWFGRIASELIEEGVCTASEVRQ